MATTTVPVIPGIQSPGMLSVWAVPTVADIGAITAEELTGSQAINLSCLLTEAPDDGMSQEKVDTNRLCLTEAIQALGKVTYDPKPLVTVYDPQNPQSELSKVYTALKPGTNWVFVFRYGLLKDVAATSGQYYDAAPVSIGANRKLPPEENTELRAEINWVISGEYVKDKQLGGVAAPATATTATAGTPGTLNGTAPADLAAMSTVTASPTTAWTTGQYVVLGDGSHAYWDGSAWATGEAA